MKISKGHITHHDDCGCLSKRKDAEIEKLRKKLDETVASLRAINVWSSIKPPLYASPEDFRRVSEKTLRKVGAWKS